MMSATRFLLAAGTAFLLISAMVRHGQAQVRLDWKRMADKLVERMALQPGERVLLVGRPGSFDSLIPELRAAIVRARAVDLGALSAGPQPFPNQATTPLVSAAAGRDRAGLAELFRDVDVAVMLPLANGTAYDAMQDVLRNGRGRTVHFHWAGAYDTNGTALSQTDGMDELYQRALLDTDYAALSARQREFETAARGAEVHVTTRAGTDLRFRIGDRPVTRQDGDASAARAGQARNLIDREIELPAGALRVAPLEETVEGTIAFPNSTWNGQPVRDLVLRLDRGKVVEIRARQGKEAVESELSAGGEAARTFREFALGFNPLLAIPDESPWIPYYGYGAGVVRLSLGDNTELGGPIGGGYVRWNFFTDATVRVGNTVWVRDGRPGVRGRSAR
jgi:hypothetical protein